MQVFSQKYCEIWFSPYCPALLEGKTLGTTSACLTIIHILQDVDFGGGVMHSQTTPDRQWQSDVEALLSFVQRVIDNHHAALLLPLALVEAKDAAVLLRTGDVVRVRQDGGGDRPGGRTFRRTSNSDRRLGRYTTWKKLLIWINDCETWRLTNCNTTGHIQLLYICENANML